MGVGSLGTQVGVGVESCKNRVPMGNFLFTCSELRHFCYIDVSFSHNTHHNRRTDGQTDDIIMPIADHTAYSTIC